ncbi:MAG TPA: ATP-binding cassette domain-containing protein [bacterium]|nr:ATP-binding cassette domain-containing protein [bacterium]
MTEHLLTFSGVSFSYDSSWDFLIDNFTGSFGKGWTGIVGPNGAGKTTLLLLACGILSPVKGIISHPQDCYYCHQRTDDPPDGLTDFLSSYESDASVLKSILGIDDGYADKWRVLSHGERKRSQLGVALWKAPEMFALDEPTNHIDSDTKSMIRDALSRYSGIGLLVSHDRELLDELCANTVYLEPPDLYMKPGGYTKAYAQIEQERKAAEKKQVHAKKEIVKLKKELHKRRMKAEAAEKAKSKKGLTANDSDAREKIDRGRVTGKDGKISRQSKSIDSRLSRTQEKSAAIRVKKNHTTGIVFDGVKLKRDMIYKTTGGSIELSMGRLLIYPALEISPASRIAVIGPNGSGKSTLINKIVNELSLAADDYIYVPQEYSMIEASSLIDQVRKLGHDCLGNLMTIVSRLNSRPERLIESPTPSPGEARKLLLALGLLKNPSLIIMDEPTNHLDIVSIQCIEQALSSCDAALLLVSHDKRFLKTLTHSTWRFITNQETLNSTVIV